MLSSLRDRAFTIYLGAVILAGGVLYALAAKGVLANDSVGERPAAYVSLALLLLLSELRPTRLLRLPKIRVERAAAWGSPATTFCFAILLLFGYAPTIAVLAVVSIVDDASRRAPLSKIAFNVSQYALATAAAGLVLHLAGWVGFDGDLTPVELLAIGAGAVTYFVVNNVLVGTVIALFSQQPLARTISGVLRSEAPLELLLLGLGPIAAVLAAQTPLILPLILLPALTVYVSTRSVLEMERRTRTDSLTGLPNRQGFRADVDEVLEQEAGRAAVVIVDLDGFKEVNDTLGHSVGDHLLTEVGARLSEEFGETRVGRIGGDEFAVLLGGGDAADWSARAERAIEVLAEAFTVDNLELSIEASAGVAIAPTDGHTANELLQRADIALYISKASPGQIVRYDSERDLYSRRRLRLLGELRSAIAEGQLTLEFQPQASLATGEVVALEALLRWRHPELGLITPDEFVPQAEHSALIGPLTRWVFGAAVEEARRQLDQRRALTVAVNVSGRALHDPALPVDMVEMCRGAGVPPASMTVEVTESAVAELGAASRVLNTLEAMGIGVSIDDFGTGYSSLTYLKELPVSELKIDRSFVAGLATDSHDVAIVRSTIELARELNMVAVAEGVETPEVAAVLRRLGCDRIQGFLLGEPMAGERLDAWLDSRAATHAGS